MGGSRQQSRQNERRRRTGARNGDAPAPTAVRPGTALVGAGGILALLLLLWWSVAGERPGGALRIDLSSPWNPTEFHVANARDFAREVAAATGGRVRIVVHPAAELGIKGPDSLAAVAQGAVPMIDMAGFQQTGLEPLFGLEALPFLVRDRDELRLLYAFLRPEIERRLRRWGLVLLYLVPWPPQNLFLDRPVDRLDDLKGLRVRTLDAHTTRLAEALGMHPRQLPAADVVPALAAGALDAVMTSTTTAAAQHYPAFLKHMLPTHHGWVVNYVVMRADVLARLGPEDRAAVLRLARERERRYWAVSAADDAAKWRELAAAGMTRLPVGPKLREAFDRIARPLWRAYVTEAPEARPILTRFLARTGRAPLETTGRRQP